jgi:uncharacterized protein YjiS (DUF1127 family)
MAMIAITDTGWERPTLRLSVPIPGVLWVYLRWRRQRRLFARLSRLGDHLIRDVGFDPDEVHGAMASPWEDVLPGRLRNR